MGGSTYNKDDYDARRAFRSSVADAKGIGIDSATFAYDHDIKTGTAAAKVHPTLDPKGVKLRESRDSDAHPVSVPIAVVFDTTGSMAHVPKILQGALTKLMGSFLNDKASGKKYLGEGYPAIMVGGFDDYNAMSSHAGSNGTLQIGQFESGMEIDDNLTNMWLTGNGGGTYDEESELALYFMARHTVHDHLEKRGKKGYLFLITDEHAYRTVEARKIKDVIGDVVQADISLRDIVAEAQEKYHVFTIIPALTQHYNDRELEKWWVDLLGQQNVLKLADPNKICEMIVGAVALCEEHAGLDDLETDGVVTGLTTALAPLAKTREVSKYSAADLPAVPGDPGGVDRL